MKSRWFCGVIVVLLAACAPIGPIRYESDPDHYPYYQPARDKEGNIQYMPMDQQDKRQEFISQ